MASFLSKIAWMIESSVLLFFPEVSEIAYKSVWLCMFGVLKRLICIGFSKGDIRSKGENEELLHLTHLRIVFAVV